MLQLLQLPGQNLVAKPLGVQFSFQLRFGLVDVRTKGRIVDDFRRRRPRRRIGPNHRRQQLGQLLGVALWQRRELAVPNCLPRVAVLW